MKKSNPKKERATSSRGTGVLKNHGGERGADQGANLPLDYRRAAKAVPPEDAEKLSGWVHELVAQLERQNDDARDVLRKLLDWVTGVFSRSTEAKFRNGNKTALGLSGPSALSRIANACCARGIASE